MNAYGILAIEFGSRSWHSPSLCTDDAPGTIKVIDGYEAAAREAAETTSWYQSTIRYGVVYAAVPLPLYEKTPEAIEVDPDGMKPASEAELAAFEANALELEIDASSQYETLYRAGEPIATFQRARVYSKEPAWSVYAVNGALVRKFRRGDVPVERMALIAMRAVENSRR